MKSDLEQRIKAAQLTKSEKKISEYILKNYLNICFKTVMDVAAEVGVSDTSVIRLTKKMHFDGFTDMQNAIKASMQSEIENSSGIRALPPAERLIRQMDTLLTEDLYEKLIETTLSNLESILRDNSAKSMKDACHTIIQSNRRFVVGFRGAAGVVESLGGYLGDVLADVRTITQADAKVIEALMDIDKDDCLVLICEPRYPNMAQTVLQMTKEAGAKIIVITDRITAPVTKDASVVLLSEVEGITHNNSYIAMTFLAELLAANIIRELGESVNPRLEKLDKYIAENKLY